MNYDDRIQETSNSVDMSAIALLGQVAGFRTFGSSPKLPVGTANIPVVVTDAAGNWEAGIYTRTGVSTLTRSVLKRSSNNGAPVTWAAGTKTVSCSLLASMVDEGMVNPDDVGYDIVLGLGQSNMCGRGAIDALVDMANERVMQFGGESAQTRYRKIFSGASPTHNSESLQNTCSPQTHFGNAYAAAIPANRRVLLVPCAYGGTTLVKTNFNGFTTAPWSAGSPGGTLYENAITQANLAIAEAQKAYPNSRVVGMIWHQGESDGDNNVTQAAYATALTAMIAGLRARVTGAANSWFIIGGLMPEAIAASAAYPAIVAAHQQVAAGTDRCMYVAGPAGYQADTWHYTAPGARVLGTRMALAVRAAATYSAAPVPASALMLSTSPSSAPVGSSTTATVTPNHPLTGAQTFSVTLTAPVAGAWSVNPVTLNVANQSVSSVFTPSATGSGNIVAATAGLAGASTAFTATAVDTTAPAFSSARVDNANPNKIIITMLEASGALANSIPPITSIAGSGGRTTTAIAINGLEVTATVDTPYTNVDTISVTYTKPGANPRLQDGSGNLTENFGPSAVTNNIAAPAPATTWNPSDKAATWALSNANLTATNSGPVAWSSIRGTSSKSGGGVYQFEALYSGSNRAFIGVGTAAASLAGFCGSDANGWGLLSAGGGLYNANGTVNSGSPVGFAAGDMMGGVLDTNAHTIRFFKGGVALGTAATPVTSTALFLMASAEGPDSWTINCGATPFAFPIAGATAWG